MAIGNGTKTLQRHFSIAFARPASASLLSLSFSPAKGVASYELSSLSDTVLDWGALATRGALFLIDKASKITCDRIQLSCRSSGTSFSVVAGATDLRLGRGSRFSINNRTSLILDSESTVALPSLSFVSDKHDCTLSLGEGASGHFQVFDGSLEFLRGDTIDIDRGVIATKSFAGQWSEHAAPIFTADIAHLSVGLGGGELRLTDVMDPFVIINGRCEGDSLVLSSAQLPVLCGTFKTFLGTLKNGSRFALPNALWFDSSGNGQLAAVSSVVIRPGGKNAEGTFVVQSRFSRCVIIRMPHLCLREVT